MQDGQEEKGRKEDVLNDEPGAGNQSLAPLQNHMTTLESIRDNAAKAFSQMFTEALPEIQSAIHDIAAEAQAQDTAAKFPISFTLTYNLDKSQVGYRLAFGVRRKWESMQAVEDPSQSEMSFQEPERN